MTYELAKQLKDADFPNLQKWPSGLEIMFPTTGNYVKLGNEEFAKFNDKWWYVPTLSELIAACGDHLVGLSRMWEGKWLTGWCAIYTKNPVDSFHSVIEGDTPEEAVANLWLALNKKGE